MQHASRCHATCGVLHTASFFLRSPISSSTGAPVIGFVTCNVSSSELIFRGTEYLELNALMLIYATVMVLLFHALQCQKPFMAICSVCCDAVPRVLVQE